MTAAAGPREGGGLTIDWLGGNCPVQAEGQIDGFAFYFRARGERWSFEVYDGVGWSYDEPYGTWPDAGWMSGKEARAFIAKAAELFRRAKAAGLDVITIEGGRER